MLLTLILISINANAFALSNDSNTITTIEQIKSVEVASGSSQNDRPVAKITHSCNVRNNAGANNKLLGKVKVGQTYFVLEQKKAPNGKVWYKINYKVNNSWICSSFCTITQGKLPTVSNNKDGNKNGNDNTKNTTKTTTANNTNN